MKCPPQSVPFSFIINHLQLSIILVNGITTKFNVIYVQQINLILNYIFIVLFHFIYLFFNKLKPFASPIAISNHIHTHIYICMYIH